MEAACGGEVGTCGWGASSHMIGPRVPPEQWKTDPVFPGPNLEQY